MFEISCWINLLGAGKSILPIKNTPKNKTINIKIVFDNKVLLITGGTGSFGNAVLDRFLDSNVAEVRIFSRDEKKQDDMRKKYKSSK